MGEQTAKADYLFLSVVKRIKPIRKINILDSLE